MKFDSDILVIVAVVTCAIHVSLTMTSLFNFESLTVTDNEAFWPTVAFCVID